MKLFTKLAAMLFMGFAVIHLLRLIIQFQVVIGNTQIPMWMSVVCVIIFPMLAYALWLESKNRY